MSSVNDRPNSVLVEIDIEELKTLLSGILAERVWRVLPGDTKMTIAKKVARRVESDLYEKLSKEIETA